MLLAFLPQLARQLIGEDLRLPSVPTWWCGRPGDLDYVLQNIEHLVIKPAFNLARTRPIVGGQLCRGELTELIERIKARPRNFVGQLWITRSTAPVMTSGGLKPWHVALRAFLVAASGSYEVMPGGLTRVSAVGDRLGDSMLAGEGSKDVWVLSEGPVAPVSLLQSPDTPIPLRRSGNDLPSRVADNLYWLGRHVERAEGAVRLLRSIILRLTSESDPANLPELPLLLRAAWPSRGKFGSRIRRHRGGKGKHPSSITKSWRLYSIRNAPGACGRPSMPCGTGPRSFATEFPSIVGGSSIASSKTFSRSTPPSRSSSATS